MVGFPHCLPDTSQSRRVQPLSSEFVQLSNPCITMFSVGYGGKYLFETPSFTHVINTCFKCVSNPWAHEEVFETARDMYDIIHF